MEIYAPFLWQATAHMQPLGAVSYDAIHLLQLYYLFADSYLVPAAYPQL